MQPNTIMSDSPESTHATNETSEIVDHSDLRKYRTEIPNMADDELDPFQYRLYAHYKRVGNCFESVRTTARITRMSIGQVVQTRNWLADNGWITVTTQDKFPTLLVKIVDRWPENFARYAKRSPGEQGVHGVNTDVHGVNASVHQVNQRSNHIRKNQGKKKPSKNSNSTPPPENPSMNNPAVAGQADLRFALTELGIGEPVLSELANSNIDVETVRDWAEHRATHNHLGPGFYVDRIRAGDVPPADNQRDDDPDRYITGKFAAFIQH